MMIWHFQRIVNNPKRGIGGTTITRLRALAAEKHLALLEACDLDESDFTRGGIRKAGRDRLKAFAAMMRDVKEKTSRLPPDKILENMMEKSGYKKMWGSMKTPDAEQRLENMGEMVQACQDFATLEDYLEHVSLVMDRDSDAGEEKVNLMTLHAAKGLEFDAVFLPGWEEGADTAYAHADGRGASRPGGRAPLGACGHDARAQISLHRLGAIAPNTRALAGLHALALYKRDPSRASRRGED